MNPVCVRLCIELNELIKEDAICEIKNNIETETNNLKKNSATAMLWLGYKEMISIVKYCRLGIYGIFTST